MKKQNNIFDILSKKTIGVAIEVHKTLGPGFIEIIYHNAMKKELDIQNIPFETEKEIIIKYKNEQVGLHRLDLLINNDIIVELKAVKEITDVHLSQIISYLKATGLNVGLILNFSKPKIDIKRVVYDK